MSMSYFAGDGSYGEADDLVVLDTADWTADDWQEIGEASDWERPALAENIRRRHGHKPFQVWFRDYESGDRMPLGWAPLFQTEAEAYAWITSRDDWEMSVWAEEANVCNVCHGILGNSVTEEVNGYERCYSCIQNESRLEREEA